MKMTLLYKKKLNIIRFMIPNLTVTYFESVQHILDSTLDHSDLFSILFVVLWCISHSVRLKTIYLVAYYWKVVLLFIWEFHQWPPKPINIVYYCYYDSSFRFYQICFEYGFCINEIQFVSLFWSFKCIIDIHFFSAKKHYLENDNFVLMCIVHSCRFSRRKEKKRKEWKGRVEER